MKFIKWCYHKAKAFLKLLIKPFVLLFGSVKYKKLDDLSKLTVYKKIRDGSWEDCYIPENYGQVKETCVRVYMPEIAVYEIKQGIVFPNSDLFGTKEGLFSYKDFSSVRSKSFENDRNVLKEKKNQLILRKRKKIHIQGKCFSILGQFDYFWAHFTIQMLPKLIFASENNIFDEKTTLIVPKVSDNNIKEAIHLIMQKNSNTRIVEVDEKTIAICDDLLIMSPTCQFSNQADYITPLDSIVPSFVFEATQRAIVQPLLNAITNPVKSDKIYLIRRNTNRRLINWPEVEEYFKSQGFELIEASKYSLKEKVAIFSTAKIIVAPYSSALSNIVATKCSKILIFSNIARTFEMCYPTMMKNGNNTIMFVSGEDEDPHNPIHSSYYIPLEKIKKAYKQLIS